MRAEEVMGMVVEVEVESEATVVSVALAALSEVLVAWSPYRIPAKLWSV